MRRHLVGAISIVLMMMAVGFILIRLNPVINDGGTVLDPSRETGQPVFERISRAAWPTVLLFLGGSSFSFLAGVPLGVGIGISRRTFPFGNLLALLGMLPALVVGFLFLDLFAAKLDIFPLYGLVRFPFPETALDRIADLLYHLFLPSLVVALADGNLVQVIRSSAAAVESHKKQGYLEALEGLGIRRSLLVFRYFTRSALVSALGSFRIQIPMLVGGLVIVEYVFSIPGLGRLLVRAVEYNDIPVLEGLVISLALLTGMVYLLFSLLLFVADPVGRKELSR